MDNIPTRFLVRDSGRLPQAEPVFTHYRETLEVVRAARFLDEVLGSCPAALLDGRVSRDDFLAAVHAIRDATLALRRCCESLGAKTGLVKNSVP